MEIEVSKTITITKRITKCWHSCPYYSIEGYPDTIMVCTHPETEDQGYIIEYPECKTGFPKKCPLLKNLKKQQ